MLTTEELRDLLAAEVAAPPQNLDRTSQVRGRVSATRRRRAVASGLATAVVVAVASLVVVPRLGDHGQTVTPVTPSPSATADTPLPDYHLGGVLIAQSQNIGSDTFRVPFTAMNKHLTITLDCYVPGASDDGDTMVSLEVNGSSLGSMSCSDDNLFGGASSFSQEPGGFDAIQPGHPANLVVFFADPVPEQSRVRIGIYEQVPLASYHFPEAPDPLPPLDLYGNLLPRLHKHPLALVSAGPLTADAGDTFLVGPTGTWSGSFTINRGLDVQSQTVAPGELHVLVNGKEVASHFGWDYSNGGAGARLTLAELGIHKGDTVTLEVRAERFPGQSWAVLLSDEAPCSSLSSAPDPGPRPCD